MLSSGRSERWSPHVSWAGLTLGLANPDGVGESDCVCH